MKPVVQPDLAEGLVVDYLADVLSDQECTVSVGVPPDWKPTDQKHLEVASDGSPNHAWPIVSYVTIRLVARAENTTTAQQLCARAYGLLCAHPGGTQIAGVKPGTDPLAARDPQTRAELASATARVTVRTKPIV